MSDEKNQNDQVQDLLARLRAQMSQLDEDFGLPQSAKDADTEIDADASPAVSEEAFPLDNADGEAEEAPSTEEEEVAPIEEIIPPEEDAVLDEEAEPSTEEAEPTPKTPKTLTQLDIFGALDALFASQEEQAPVEEIPTAPQAEESEDALDKDDDGEDDVPVFSKDQVSVRIQKERIVADETLAGEAPAPQDGIVVTEVELPVSEPSREQAETHASFFVPDSTPAEDASAAPASASPFAPDRRFDPTRYDEMLAAYEKRKKETLLPEDAPEEEAPRTPVVPQTPILMPRVPVILPVSVEEDTVTDETDAPEEDITPLDIPVEDSPVRDEAEEAAPVEEAPEAEPETAESPVDEAAETAPEAVEVPQEQPSQENSAPEENTPKVELSVPDVPEEPKPQARILVAKDDLSDTERAPRTHVSSGRVHLAPKAYRAKDTKGEGKEKADLDDEEDYMEGLPLGIRESLVGSPLGRPNRAQGAKHENTGSEKKKKARKSYRFLEEIVDTRNEDASPDYVHHHIEVELRQTRIRLIVISILAFVLLLLENITHVTASVPHGFVDVTTAGVVDMLLLFGAMIAAWPRLRTGIKGIRYGRILPESVLLAEIVIALVYAAAFGFSGAPVKYFSFVPALGLSILYSFRVLSCEEKLKTLERLTAKGEKLLLAPTAKKDMQAEMRALGNPADTPLVYRIRKTAAVKGFLRRSTVVCEDEGANLGILLAMLGVGAASFVLSFFVGGYSLNESLQSVLFGCFLASPIFMCGVHVYAMHRTVEAAGEDSVIVGEASVHEATTAKAIAFEDVEAAPSTGVLLSGIRVHCDDPSSVFKYLTALYGHIGGPLCGRFSGIYTDKSVAATALVELVDATADGVSAAVDGAEIVVGNGRYLTASHITSVPGVSDGKPLSDARNGVLYVAVNRMVCMTFYMEHKISQAFEKNVLQLHRLGIAAILRTYDPNFNEDTVARSAVLRDCHVHVVSKTVEERNDFYAERAEGGIATSGSTGKLLKLFLLCFRTRKLLRFGRGFKLFGTVLGGALSALLCVFGIFHIVPSVYLALYHLVLLAIYMLIARVGIRLSGGPKEK